MARDEKIRIVLEATGDGQVRASLAGVRQAFSQTQASIITLNQALDLFGKAWGLASGAVSSAARFMGDAIRASNEQENALRLLNQTLVSTGQFTVGYSQALQDLASQFQSTTTFGDELVMEVERLLVAFGATPDQIGRVTQAALDLATGLGVDATDAARLLGKALAGEFGTLARYGIFVDENASKTEKLNQALQQIEIRFGGQAQAAAETFAGRLAQLSNLWGDLLEKIGDAIKSSDFLNDALEALRGALIGTNAALQDAQLAVSGLDKFLRNVALFAADVAAALLSAIKPAELFTAKIVLAQRGLSDLLTGNFGALADDLKALFTKGGEPIDALTSRLAELRARIESFGTDGPRQLASVASATAEVGAAAKRTVVDYKELASEQKRATEEAKRRAAEEKKALAEINAEIERAIDTIKRRLDAEEELNRSLRDLEREATLAVLDESERRRREFEFETEDRLEKLRTQAEAAGKTEEEITQIIEDARRAREEVWEAEERARIEKAEEVSVSLGRIFDRAIEDITRGVLQGTRDWSSILDDWKDVAISIFAEWVTESLKQKLGFDQIVKGNIFDLAASLPGLFTSGLSLAAAGTPFAALFGLGGGAGAGAAGLGGLALGPLAIGKGGALLRVGPLSFGIPGLPGGAIVPGAIGGLLGSILARELGLARGTSGAVGSGIGGLGGALGGFALAGPIGAALGSLLAAFGGGSIGGLFTHELSPGQRFRRTFIGDVLRPTASVGGLIPEDVPFRFAESLGKFPELAAQATDAVRAFAIAYGEAVKTPLNLTDEMNNTLGILIGSFGEAGVSGQEAIVRIASLMRELGITTDQARAMIQEAFDQGKIGFNEYQSAMAGLAQVTSVTTGEIVSTLEQRLNAQARQVFERLKAAGIDSMTAILLASKGVFVDIVSSMQTQLLPGAAAIFALIESLGIKSAEAVRRAFESLSDLSVEFPGGTSPQGQWFVGASSGKLFFGFVDPSGRFVPLPAPALSPEQQAATRRTAPKIPGLAVGGSVVESGIAVVHKGEEIVTASLVREIRELVRELRGRPRESDSRIVAGLERVVDAIERSGGGRPRGARF